MAFPQAIEKKGVSLAWLVWMTPDFCPNLDIDSDNRDQYKKIIKGSVKISENTSDLHQSD